MNSRRLCTIGAPSMSYRNTVYELLKRSL
uniref:Uncharacterized protein n=1 Tax=Arundo donax TaxID=35708 RepID=A0A0A9FNT2_ARUDO